MAHNIATAIGEASIVYPRLFVATVMIMIPVCLAFVFTYSDEINSYVADIIDQEIFIANLLYFFVIAIVAYVLGNNIGTVALSFTEKFHHIIPLDKTVTAFQFGMQFVYVAVPLLIASLTYDVIVHQTIFLETSDLTKLEKLKYALNGALAFGIFAPVIISMLTSFLVNFQYYRALGFLKRIRSSMDELEKIDNIAYAIHFYNKYLDERMEHQFANTGKIISKLVRTPIIDSFVRELINSFESSEKLLPLRQLTSFVNTPTNENFLIKIHTQEKIRQWTPIIVGLVTSIIVISNLVYNYFFT